MLRAAAVLLLVALATTATAQSVPRPPTSPRVVHAPTAWLQPAGQLHVDLAASHRLAPSAAATFGLGVGEVELELTDRLIACPDCGELRAEENFAAATAAFRMGAATSTARPWRAGAVLGFRRTIATRTLAGSVGSPESGPLEAAQLHLVVGARVAGLEVHAGAELLQARHAGAGLDEGGEDGFVLRPLAAIAWTPPPYPRTTMMLDVAWVPELAARAPDLSWILGWGVRYQALPWGAIDLVVRQREDAALGDATVLVRVSGVLKLGRPLGVDLR